MSFIIEPFRETIPISRDGCFLRTGPFRKRVESRADMKTEMNISSFLTRYLRACARASRRYDVEDGTRSLARSLDWSIPVNFFSILGF